MGEETAEDKRCHIMEDGRAGGGMELLWLLLAQQG